MDEPADIIAEENQPKQSQLGIASFIISIISAAIFSIIIITSTALIRTGLDIGILAFSFMILHIDLGICITGLALGITGMFTKHKKRSLAIAGIVINLWFILMLYLFFTSSITQIIQNF